MSAPEGAGQEDIAVVLTPATRGAGGAIGTIAVDGPTALERLNSVLRARTRPSEEQSGRLIYGRIVGGSGEPIDEVIVAVQDAAESETGQPHAEVGTHGGPVAIEAVLTALLGAGFRSEPPSALWRRALASGRIDLVSLECRFVLAGCPTARQAAYVARQAPRLAEACRALLADLDQVARQGVGATVAAGRARKAIDALVDAAAFAEALLAHHRVTVVGPVNGGKSTLVNRLAGEQRLLVSSQPGTTRDPVEVPVELDGLAVTLTDTAGEREPEGPVEAEGQTRAAEALARSDLVLLVLDAHEPLSPERLAALEHYRGLPLVVALNKSDLDEEPGLRVRLARALSTTQLDCVSARTGEGVDLLVARIARALLGGLPEPDTPGAFTARQWETVYALEEPDSSHAILPASQPTFSADPQAVESARRRLRRLLGLEDPQAELRAILREHGDAC